MPASRRIVTPLLAITTMIILSVLAVISLAEGFKQLGVGSDGVKIRKRDTITFSMPWNPPLAIPKPEVKAISETTGSILDAVEKVAAALLDDGSDIASVAQGAESSLASSILAGGPSQVPSRIQSVISAVGQATGVVGGIVSAATAIVGSLIAETGAASLTSVVGGGTSSAGGNTTAASITRTIGSTSGLNLSSPTSSLAFKITSAPVQTAPPSTSATTCGSCTACPTASTKTCTVTETWHSTHYESTATLFSFVAAFTYTCTETVSVCPKSSLYPLAPPTVSSAPPTNPPLIACLDGALAKRAEDCPPAPSPSNATMPDLVNASTPSLYPGKASPTHPCPNAGYSCSECPGGVFCPPTQTSAQDCSCGFGWACGHCSQGWFCIPSPTPGPVSGLASSDTAPLGHASVSQPASSVPSTMGSFTANIPSLSSGASAPAMVGSGSGPLQAFPTSSGPLNQATNAAGTLASNIINNVNSALGNVDGLSGAILSSVMGQLSSVISANFPFGNVNPTAVSGPAGNLISSATSAVGNVLSNGAAAVSNPAGGLIPTATGIVGSVTGNVLSNLPAVGGNPATGLVPIATAIVGSIAGSVLSNLPVVGGNPATGLVPTVTAIAGSVAGNVLSNLPVVVGNPAAGLVPTVTAIAGSVAGNVLSNLPVVGGNPAAGLVPIATGIVGSITGNILSNIPAVGGNPAAGLVPIATAIVGSVTGNSLSNLPVVGGNPAAGLVPIATAVVAGVASQLVPAAIPSGNNPAGGLIPLAASIIVGVNSDLLGAGIPLATPAPLFQPIVSVPVINNALPVLGNNALPVLGNNALPVLGKAVQPQVTRMVIPQPLSSTGAPSLTSIQTEPATPDNGPIVISHLTTTIQGTPTVLPVVITLLNGKPTVVPLVKMVVDGREKDLPVVGFNLGAGVGVVEAAKGVLDSNGAKRRRNRGGGLVEEKELGA